MAVAETAASAGMGPLGWLSLGLGGIGLLGSLFGGEEEMTDEQRQTYEMLLKRSGGLDPKLLALMRARMRGSVGNEAAGLASTTSSRLRRQDAPVAVQEQYMDKLAQRRMGATSDALLGVDTLNENIKGDALGQLASFTGRFPQKGASGQGFNQLFGMGLQGLLSDYGGEGDFMSKLDQHQRAGYQMGEFNFRDIKNPRNRVTGGMR